MVSMEGKHEICSPFIPRRNALRKTSAEIVGEARQFLRVQSTQRPFTPRDGHRQLFGKSSVRAHHGNRPPSTFRLVTNSKIILFSLSVSEICCWSHVICESNEPFFFIAFILMLLTQGQVQALASLLWTTYVHSNTHRHKHVSYHFRWRYYWQ